MSKKIIGYGLCGPGESKRYMRQTLDCFKRLCDEVIILCNNCDQAEINLIAEYGFQYRQDRREWGAHQWRIKQDFIERDIKQIANEGDVLVCLDMDEVLSDRLTKEWLMEAPLDAYHVFIVDLWNDPEHFKLESCFWNVRIWKWNGETKFKAKPVHCGLAPEWTYYYHRHAPFILKHYGLMLPEDRARKVKRYEKYDPNAEHLDRRYYDMLKSNTARPFDEEALSNQIAEEVATYKQTKPRSMPIQKKQRFAYVRNPHGAVVDIPEKHLEMTMKRKGFEFIGWADEQQEEIEALFEDEPEATEEAPISAPEPKNTYARSIADEKAEIDTLNARDDAKLTGFMAPPANVEIDEDVDAIFEDEPAGEIHVPEDTRDLADVDVHVTNEPPAETKVEIPAPSKKPAAKKKRGRK